MGYTVGEVARLAGVSVRALHHYDELGLLSPSARSEAGYRIYGEADLEKLQQVLFFRELGFALEEVGRIVNDPSFDRREALRMQREQLSQRKTRLEAMIGAVDEALEALEKGRVMDKQKMFEGFDPAQYEEEARERWGDTEAYKESKRRTARYSKRDWETIKREGDQLQQRLAALMAAGRGAGDPEVQQVAEEHRRHIDKWFYPCSKQFHRNLGELYVSDPRFTANIDKLRPGLAQFTRDAIAFAADHEG